MPENTLLNSVEMKVFLSRIIINEPEWTSLFGSQVYFEELDLGLKKLHKGGESLKRDSL